jgi:hypothetical protein
LSITSVTGPREQLYLSGPLVYVPDGRSTANNGQSPKKEDYVSESYNIVKALHSLMLLYASDLISDMLTSLQVRSMMGEAVKVFCTNHGQMC